MTDQEAQPDVRGPAAREALRWQYFTIGYNAVECAIAVTAGIGAGSVALVGFGADAGIELVAALLIVIRLRSAIRRGTVDQRKEQRALKFVATTFFALAAFLTVEAIRELTSDVKPGTSIIGIVLTALSILIMPWLATVKHKLGVAMNYRLLVADAAETRLCAWLSVTTFTGLLGYAALGWTWIDALAGLVIAGLAVKEGHTAWTGALTWRTSA
ncbi:cation transporter [Amycolatopsis lurida]